MLHGSRFEGSGLDYPKGLGVCIGFRGLIGTHSPRVDVASKLAASGGQKCRGPMQKPVNDPLFA